MSAVERLVGERVTNAEQRQAITEKIVDTSVHLVDERGKTRLTTHEVLEAERTLATAADGLASRAATSRSSASQINVSTNSSGAPTPMRRTTTRG